MNRNSNAAALIALAVVGSLLVLGLVVGGVGFLGYRLIENKRHDIAHSAHSTTSTATYTVTESPSSTWDTTSTTTPTTTTTTTETILYGGIAYSGSGAYETRVDTVDGTATKTEAVNKCNNSIWSKGWSSASYCGYVPIQTGECASVATATVASGWGPTGWASGSNGRSVIVAAALDKCNGLGQGVCHELVTVCM
ncbi:DUF4189 domain-containing protein [Gordonia sp. TBRC 11910]|uniref:DUF4189 domain-containing protein n=1 Tax=Gordonia asplenii TaxID=2725283 RepID=A0A848L7M9_9ACTN|nr:DUF4189 domain-containing protein [Gordonia asplenii]NMO04995.1 DUF4189 domain-containing protein [Gordonia asplenii]